MGYYFPLFRFRFKELIISFHVSKKKKRKKSLIKKK